MLMVRWLMIISPEWSQSVLISGLWMEARLSYSPARNKQLTFPTTIPFWEFQIPMFPHGEMLLVFTVSGHFTDRLFHTETARTINFDDRNITSVSSGNMNMGRKLVEDPWSNDSTFGLSMSHTLEDPISGLNYSGVRKVKVSQVKYCDSVNILSASMGHPYSRGSNNTLSMVHTYNKADDNTISMGLTYNNRDENNISMGDAFVREDNNLISMGQPCSKGGDNIPIGHSCKGDEATISMGQPFSKGDGSIILMGQTYSKGDQNTISMGQFTQDDHNIISMGQSYIKRDDNTISTGHIYNRRNKTTISMSDNNNLSMGHLYNRECSNIISFGGYDDDTKPAGICSYDLLIAQSPVQISEAVNEKDLVESNGDALVDASKISSSGTVSKKKEKVKISKKDPSNSFPSNVRSLLSTGMLDGVPVKYIAWSREELRGVIRGSGYMCSCQSCNFSKLINAYEFERHAGCKTKHPNNHIYFENGKTIYGIVQELRSTPQNMLFEVIQTITGSPINQKFFRLWKESFLAATSELQRIYGKDEGKLLS